MAKKTTRQKELRRKRADDLRHAETPEAKAQLEYEWRKEELFKRAQEFARKWGLGVPDTDYKGLWPAWPREHCLLVFGYNKDNREVIQVVEQCAKCSYGKVMLDCRSLFAYGAYLNSPEEDFEWECPRCNPKGAAKERLAAA